MARTKTIEQLQRELQSKQRVLKRLTSRRAKLQVRLETMDRQIAQLTGQAVAAPKPGPARRGRPPGPRPVRRRRRGGKGPTLVEAVKGVLASSKEGMRVMDIAKAVREQGYKSGSKNFYGMVAAAVRDPKLFKRTGRGMYQLA